MDAGSEDDLAAGRQGRRQTWRARIFFANAGIVGRLRAHRRTDRRRLGRDPARQPDRPVPGDQVCRPGHREGGGGSIICTASVAGLRSGAGGAAYSAPRPASSTSSRLPRNSSPDRVRVNAICPGLIETGMTKPLFELARDPAQEQRIGELNPGAARRRAARNRQRGAVPRLGRVQLRQRRRAGGRWRPRQQPPHDLPLRHQDDLTSFGQQR